VRPDQKRFSGYNPHRTLIFAGNTISRYSTEIRFLADNTETRGLLSRRKNPVIIFGPDSVEGLRKIDWATSTYQMETFAWPNRAQHFI
jgi:hypothetical protein